MKHVRKLLYLLGVIVAIMLLVLAGTAMVQAGVAIVSEKLGVSIAEDCLYQVSGSCGIAIAAFMCAGYVKRKKYVESTAEKFSMKQAVFYMMLSACVCRVVSESGIAMLFSNFFPVVEQIQGRDINIYVDFMFAFFVAPITEELLFRMGIYTLLKRRFSKGSAITICALGFALMHGYQLQGFLSCLIAGYVFTLIYEKTGSLWYSIAAHMFCNLFASVFNVLEYAGVTWFGVAIQYEVNGYNTYHPVIIIVALAFCGACVVRFNKHRVSGAVLQGN